MQPSQLIQTDPRLRDKWWRITHLYKIKDKKGRLVTFKPSKVQTRHWIDSRLKKRKRILKYRQGGFTTLYCIDYLDDAIFTPGLSAAIIAHERQALDRIFGIVKRAYENMPDSVKPQTAQDTLRSYRFEKSHDGQILDSEIYVALKLRGGTVQKLHVTERAYITGGKSQELEAGSKQAVPLSGVISEETTANGMGEFYDDFMANWKKGDLGFLDYVSYFYAWHEQAEYTLPGSIEEYTAKDLTLKKLVADAYEGKELTDGQLLWYRWKEQDIGKKKTLSGLRPDQLMKQEYPSTVLEAFQAGFGNVFDLQRLEEVEPKEPIEVLSNGLKVWQKPIKAGMEYTAADGTVQKATEDFRYVIGGDPSGGDADDQTVIDVWCIDTSEQVAQWAGHLRPDESAELARDIAVMYNDAFAGIENNMLSMVLFLSKIYDNIYSVTVPDEKRERLTRKIGWNTNSKTRDLMIDEFLMKFEEGAIVINSALTISEMRTFVKKESGKREHADGKHDDALFAAMIAIQMFKHHKFRRKKIAFSKPAGF